MREHRLELRLTEEEYKRLCSLASSDSGCRMKRSGRPSLSSYIRKCALCTGDPSETLRGELKDLIYQIRKEGVNINQAVKKINAGFGSRDDVVMIRDCQHRIETLLSEVRDLAGG